MCTRGLEMTAGRRRRAAGEKEKMKALREMTRGDGAWHNYYRSRITAPAGARRSRGANLPEYSLPRELISVVIIISAARSRDALSRRRGARSLEFSGLPRRGKLSDANVCASAGNGRSRATSDSETRLSEFKDIREILIVPFTINAAERDCAQKFDYPRSFPPFPARSLKIKI